jgi:hypothetical protein
MFESRELAKVGSPQDFTKIAGTNGLGRGQSLFDKFGHRSLSQRLH